MATKTNNSTSSEYANPEQAYAARAKRLDEAFHLKQPDRIPIMMPASFMLAEVGGITKQELQENPEKAQELLEQVALEYQPDSISGLIPADPTPHYILGDRMTAWPGHQLPSDSQFQFVEGEYLKADEYDALLEDPGDFAVRTYLPRAFSALEGFSNLLPLGMWLFGCYNLMNIGALMAPPVVESVKALAKAAQATADSMEVAAKNQERMDKLGFPPSFLVGSIIEAPYDLMSDTLRGMRGIMLDMLQRPDKLLQAEERVLRFQLEFAISFSQMTGLKNCFIPLHRGSDGFMSLEQFEKFYWPQLKEMIETLVKNGITPTMFYEGVWDQRLEHLAELPKAKTAGWFQRSDIFKVKEVVGDTLCIMGGMPNSMLKGGSVEEVREHTKKVCEIVGKNGGFIMATGTGEMLGSDPKLVRAWVDATREYGAY